MKLIFKDIKLFTFCFLAIVFMDLYLLTNSNLRYLRLITKPLLLLLLIIYYIVNSNDKKKKDLYYTIFSLFCFLVAGIANHFFYIFSFIIMSSVFFIIGKIFYVFRFSNKNDFDFKIIIPFLVFFFLYMGIVLSLIFDGLGNLLVLILTFLFVTLLGILFSLIRKNSVNKKSYLFVVLGMLLLLSADTISILTSFYKYWPSEKYVVMLLYAMAQYFIVIGLVKESEMVIE